MREILFRGKRTKTGEWVEGLLFVYNDKAACIYSDDLDRPCWVRPETVGQAVPGVKDKNGKHIFEGDIVRGCMGDMVVFFDEIIGDGYGFQWKSAIGGYTESMTGFIDEYEVIGNIHDNPELLKKED